MVKDTYRSAIWNQDFTLGGNWWAKFKMIYHVSNSASQEPFHFEKLSQEQDDNQNLVSYRIPKWWICQ